MSESLLAEPCLLGGVGAGVGRIDGFAHHVEGRERVERAGCAHAFVAEQLHDECVLASWRPLCERCFSAV